MKKIIIIIMLMMFLLSSCSEQRGEYQKISLKMETLGEDNEYLETAVKSKTKTQKNYEYDAVEKINMYKIIPINISNDIYDKFKNHFKIEVETTTSNGKLFIRHETEFGTTFLTIYDNNQLSYSFNSMKKEEPLIETDEDLIDLAKQAFYNLPFDTSSYECIGITSTVLYNDEYYVEKSISFRSVVDGLRVLGDDMCYISFDSSGLCALNITLYEYEKIGEMDLVPFSMAEKNVKNPDVMAIYSNTNENFKGEAKTMRIDEVNIRLVNQNSSGCEILQPVYSFKGKLLNDTGSIEFNSRIIAIPDKYTYDPEPVKDQ